MAKKKAKKGAVKKTAKKAAKSAPKKAAKKSAKKSAKKAVKKAAKKSAPKKAAKKAVKKSAKKSAPKKSAKKVVKKATKKAAKKAAPKKSAKKVVKKAAPKKAVKKVAPKKAAPKKSTPKKVIPKATPKKPAPKVMPKKVAPKAAPKPVAPKAAPKVHTPKPAVHTTPHTDHHKQDHTRPQHNTHHAAELNSTLSISGLHSAVSVKNNNEPLNLYFVYGYDGHGNFMINRVTELTQEAMDHPLDRDIKSMVAKGHSHSSPALIKHACIRFEAVGLCEGASFYEQSHGNEAEFKGSVHHGAQHIDLTREVGLGQFIADIHKSMHSMDAGCPTLDDLKQHPARATEKLITLRLLIYFEVNNDDGKKTVSNIKLQLRATDFSHSH